METKNQPRPSDAKPRALRLKAKGHLLVQAKTIGTNMSYVLSPENASSSGFLLSWNKEHQLPFALNTILEISLHPNAKSSVRIPCLGKVVRKENIDGRTTSYGVKIVQMDAGVAEQWHEFVSEIAKKQSPLLPAA